MKPFSSSSSRRSVDKTRFSFDSSTSDSITFPCNFGNLLEDGCEDMVLLPGIEIKDEVVRYSSFYYKLDAIDGSRNDSILGDERLSRNITILDDANDVFSTKITIFNDGSEIEDRNVSRKATIADNWESMEAPLQLLLSSPRETEMAAFLTSEADGENVYPLQPIPALCLPTGTLILPINTQEASGLARQNRDPIRVQNLAIGAQFESDEAFESVENDRQINVSPQNENLQKRISDNVLLNKLKFVGIADRVRQLRARAKMDPKPEELGTNTQRQAGKTHQKPGDRTGLETGRVGPGVGRHKRPLADPEDNPRLAWERGRSGSKSSEEWTQWTPPGKSRKSHRGPRSRSGCWTCRLRHKACPEDKPICGECRRLGLVCDYSFDRPSYMVETAQAQEKLRQIRQITNQCKRGRRPGKRH